MSFLVASHRALILLSSIYLGHCQPALTLIRAWTGQDDPANQEGASKANSDRAKLMEYLR